LYYRDKIEVYITSTTSVNLCGFPHERPSHLSE